MLNERVPVQCLRVHYFAFHDPSLGQTFPDGDWVHVVHAVVFLLGIELVRLNELGDPALDLCPGQIHFRTVYGDMERLGGGVELHGQPFRCLLFPPVHFHVPDYGVFALNTAVPRLDRPVNVRLRDLPLYRCRRRRLCHFVRLHFVSALPFRFGLRGQIAVLGYQRVDPPGDLGPGKGNLLRVGFP